MKFTVIGRHLGTDFYIICHNQVEYYILESLDELRLGSSISGNIDTEVFYDEDNNYISTYNLEETGSYENSIRILNNDFR